MFRNFGFIFIGQLFLLLLCPLFSDAKVVGLLDFDGTIVQDRGPKATWITPWLLKRVEQIHSPAQQMPNRPFEVALITKEQVEYYNSKLREPKTSTSARIALNLPEQIAISYDEYLELQPFLAKGESVLGSLHPYLLNEDPLFPDRQRLIVPGYYRTFDLTFKYYRESTGLKSKNFLKANLDQARERTKLLGEDYSWKGPAFPLFKALMSSQETIANAFIFTSRGHNQKEYQATWDNMVKAGEIPFSKSSADTGPVVFSLAQPEARIFGKTLVEKKVEVVKNVLEALYHSSGHRHSVLNHAGIAKRVHTLIVAEDEPSYVEAIAELLLNASGGYYADRIELVLLNTGSDLELANSRFKARWTKFEAGRRVREAHPEEIANWLDPEFHRLALGLDCQSILKVKP